MKRKVRLSTFDDVPVLLQLADEARATMRQSGNMNQWGNGYPTADDFRRDIEQHCSYIIEEDGRAVATFAFIPSPEPTYARIYEGAWIDVERPYYVVHRIASLAESRGIMTTLFDFCSTVTDNLRIDTHRDNHIMQHLLLKHGFSYCGIIYLKNGDERLAYQRLTNEKPSPNK